MVTRVALMDFMVMTATTIVRNIVEDVHRTVYVSDVRLGTMVVCVQTSVHKVVKIAVICDQANVYPAGQLIMAYFAVHTVCIDNIAIIAVWLTVLNVRLTLHAPYASLTTMDLRVHNVQ